ncbi:helix-turn-helix transcriptional regulator [Paenibacillus algorifonticola]|uniref:helix-turn-helix transcriptional regulator n=1 Tax=Paenibacillus algorifonticola TaxID=684063 RepID=UPI0009E2496A
MWLAVESVKRAYCLRIQISIGEIGRIIGGFSAPYFSQLFKKHKGITPNSYRIAIKNTYR